MNLTAILVTVLFAGLATSQEAASQAATDATHTSTSTLLTEAQKVERLIQYVRGLEGATFIRNGSEHNCKEAADHLHAKWTKHMSKIRTAQEFITEIASASGITGEAYLIKFPDGTTVETKQVLMQELKRLEQY